MQRNRSRRSLALLLAALTAIALVAPVQALAQTPDVLFVEPEISPPAGKCAIKGGDRVTFSGTASEDATLTSAVLRYRDASGDVIESKTKTLGAADISLTNGVITGGRTLTIENNTPARTVELVVTVSRGAESTSAISDPTVGIDNVLPMITGAVTNSREQLEVTFSEPVSLTADESPVDWSINGNVPASISGTGDTRLLNVPMNNRWGEDARPTLVYEHPLNRPIYADCTGNTLDFPGRTQTAKDGTAPVIPVISQIDGKSATGADPVVSKEKSPQIVITTVTNGHTVTLWRETNKTPGRQDADTEIGSAVASGGSVTLQATGLAEGVNTFYARSADTEADKPNKDLNYSGEDEALYNIDTVAPRLVSATANGANVLVVFDEALATGPNNKDQWTITLGNTDYDVTGVSGQGSQRTLTVASNVPTGSTLNYSPGQSGYADAAGNPAPGATVPVDSDFLDPSTMTLDVQPESQERASGSHTFTLKLLDYFGAPVQGRRLGGKVLTGPNAGRNLDNNLFTGTGVFGTCVTDAAGSCSLSYGTQDPGSDVVLGWIDVNNNSSADEVTGTPEPSDASGASDVSSHDTVDAETSDTTPDPEPSPSPSPSPSVTPSPAPSGSPSPSPSPSPSASASPSPDPSTSPSPSTPPTPTPEPVQERSVTLQSDKSIVDLGRPTRLSGLVAASEACRAGAQVRILRDTGTGAEEIGTVTADPEGLWAARLSSTSNATYQVEILEAGPCGAATSDEVTVKVRAAVEAFAKDPILGSGDCAKVAGRVAPNKAGTPVWLQLRTRRGGWRAIDSDLLSGRSRFSFPACFDKTGRKTLRVKWATDGANAAATSTNMQVRVN